MEKRGYDYYNYYTGNSLTYTNWLWGEPNFIGHALGREDCAILTRDSGGEWKDIPCHDRVGVLCELYVGYWGTAC